MFYKDYIFQATTERGGNLMSDESTVLMNEVERFFKHIFQELEWFLEWTKNLDSNERQAFLLDLLRAVNTHDAQQVQIVMDEWQATVQALGNGGFMKAWQAADNPDDYVPWEQVRGDSGLSGETEEGR
jgi:hypothetical protein